MQAHAVQHCARKPSEKEGYDGYYHILQHPHDQCGYTRLRSLRNTRSRQGTAGYQRQALKLVQSDPRKSRDNSARYPLLGYW